MASLGNTVANLSRVVPHGLLVFFPSFPLMEKTLEFWKANGHANRIENIKPMFVEPKGKGTFNDVIDGYYSKVNDPASKGGSFFAVCRGKASEGLDFADTYGRGVIITGLPFPPKNDPRVILKMQFLDEMNRKKAPGLKYLSGQDWYKQQAFRAVNQAIGRVIRHKEDYGAIFLCDQRFKSADARAQLPSWVRSYVRLCDSFGNVVRDVSQFFRIAQKMRPVVEKKAPADNCATVCSSDTQSSSFTSCSSSQTSHTQKAKVLDTCLPSLKKRRLNENSGASGMASICHEYESEVLDNQRRPANLLDALEQGNHSTGEDSGFTMGEEKANHLSTLSLQYDKRMEDELRGGKRKIKLVQEQKPSVSEDLSEEGKASRAKKFLADMKKSLSQVSFDRIIQALQTYKKTDDLDQLLTETAILSEDTNTQSLLHGFYQFVRPHHKKRFDENCQELTGKGCGYKPDHTLSKDEKKTVMLQNGSASKNEVHTTFLTDVKKALGAERSTQLFQAIHTYKKTDNYEKLVTTAVSLFTERDENFGLLVRFGMFIRPNHKKQYKDMLDGLIGQPVSAPDVPVMIEEQQEQPEASLLSPLRSQSKISSFFSSSQRR